MAKLIVRKGVQLGSEFPADRPQVTIGRGSGCDVILQDSQASRRHAEISQQGGQFFVRDLGSTNGTFVNNRQVVGSQPLQPGDEIRIGDTVLAYESGYAAAGPMTTDWEAELWDDGGTAAPAAGQNRTLLWALGGLVAVLIIALVVMAVTMLREPTEPTPEVAEPTSAPTSAIVVVPTEAPTEGTEDQVVPSSTPLVDLPTVEPVDTVAVEATAPKVEVPTGVPQAVPSSLPLGPEALEQLPAIVTQMFPGVPQEQLPQAMAEQMQTMSPEELQSMIGALFPGTDPAQLPEVVAASFPDMPRSEIENLLAIAFPGQNFQIPDMAPVGGRIALGIHREGQEGVDLYLVNAMGGQRTLLVEDAQEPGFSPDGQWLVYSSWAPDRLGMRLIKADGSGDTELTAVQGDSYASFSPDGQRIVFYNREQSSIVVINRDGSGRREIIKGEYPAWSPTGDQIVYRGCLGGGKCGLLVANADGSNPRQITTHANDAAPRWSPNGGQVVFHSDRDGNWEVYVINVDGSWLRRITISPATDVMPVWSPDGLRIAFLSDRGGSQGVYTTSGIGGGAIKQFEANYPTSVGPWLKLDWSK